jgi:ubiquinone biosynthesis protein
MLWRSLLIRILVNFTAIFLTVLLMPGFNVINPWLGSWVLDLLAAALILALLNAFVKPVLQILTGRLTIATLGLFGFIINAIVLGLLIWISRSHWELYYGVITLLIAGALIAIFSTILEAILGVDKPIIDTSEDSPTYWRLISRLPLKRRSWLIENIRLQQTYNTIAHYVADITVSRTPLSGLRHGVQRWIYGQKEHGDLTAPQKVRILLQDLGPTYVKIGQMASSRPELLPAGYPEELAKLQSTVRPFPYDQVVEVIKRELKMLPEVAFKEFEKEPLAAASTAQVHRAVLHTGEEVVVKVQRPDIIPQVRADLGVMHEIAGSLQRRHVVGPSVAAVGTIDEFGENVMLELDYQNEAYNARRAAYNMQTIAGVHVPKIYSQQTTSKVLTMEFIRGVKLNKVEKIDAAGLDRKQLARTFIRAIMKQVLVDGFFHGDPHPGNLMIDLETGVIQFLDLGMVGEIDLQQRISLGDLLFSLQNRDPDGLASALLGVSVPFRPDADEVGFKHDIERVVTRYMIYAEVGASLSEVLSAVTKSLADNGFRLNPNMTLAIKVIVQVEEVMSTLNPEESMVFGAIEEAQVVLKQELTLEKIGDMAKKEATNFLREAVKRLPELQGATLKWLDNYQKGRFEIFVDTSDLGKHIDRFNVSAERMMVGMILAGMLIGGAIALAVPAATIVGEYIKLAVLLIFVFAAALGLWLVFRILWRSFRQESDLAHNKNPWKT